MIKIAALAIAVWASPGAAQTVGVEVGYDCGGWLQYRTSGGQMEAYALGFMDGIAMGSMVDVWNLRPVKPSREAYFAWIDKHCRENPLDYLQSALLAFVTEAGGQDWRGPRP